MQVFKDVHAQTACIGSLSVLNRHGIRRKLNLMAVFIAFPCLI